MYCTHRALEADPHHLNTLTNFAALCQLEVRDHTHAHANSFKYAIIHSQALRTYTQTFRFRIVHTHSHPTAGWEVGGGRWEGGRWQVAGGKWVTKLKHCETFPPPVTPVYPLQPFCVVKHMHVQNKGKARRG